MRFVLAAVLAGLLARALRGPLRVTRADAVRIALAGFVLNAVQFGAMYLAFDAGLGATLGLADALAEPGADRAARGAAPRVSGSPRSRCSGS